MASGLRRPAKLTSKLILSPGASPNRKEHEFRRHVTVETKDGEKTLMQVKIRAVRLQDVGSIFHLGEEVFGKVTEMSRTWDEYEVVNYYSAYFPYCAVAELLEDEKDPKIVGFILGCPIFKKNETFGNISWIAVQGSLRRQGVGSLLIKWYEAVLRDDLCPKIYVDSPDLPAAVKFFEKHGFKNPVFQSFLSLNLQDREKEKEKTETETKLIKEGDKGKEKEKLNITVREIEVGDFTRVAELGNALFDDDLFWDEGEIIDMFQTDSECCLVAEYNGEIVGFTLGSTVQKKEAGRKKKQTYGYLVWIGVDKKYHRKGVAAVLYQHFLDVMDECDVKSVLVDTSPSNSAAKNFFKRAGFKMVANHVFMEKDLIDLLP